MPTISRQEHAALFGPTVGDKIRLGDTDLFVEIEKDLRHYGDESMYGGGKTLRGGMGGDARLNRDAGVLDLVITNVTVIDAVQGVIKADVGIRDGRIVGIGKSGNPFTFRVVNDRLAFYMNDTEVAYLSDNKLYVTQAEILARLQIGKFAYEPQSNGNLSVIYTG